MDPVENPQYGDCYFTSVDAGDRESEYVFVRGSGFADVLDSASSSAEICLGETGFGTGLNAIMTLRHCVASGKEITLQYCSVDKYPLSPDGIRRIIAPFYDRIQYSAEALLQGWSELYENLQQGFNRREIALGDTRMVLDFFYGEARDFLSALSVHPDIWYLDGHSPECNPDMWSAELLHRIGRCSRKGTALSTYTAAGVVKQGLRAAGFRVVRKKGFGRKHHMVYAVKEALHEE
ncbi:MAG: tRNA (5-methylaminomethyl-2-thiouridine)(34)-methyltransferase MnmD [Fibrobacterota bacterium]